MMMVGRSVVLLKVWKARSRQLEVVGVADANDVPAVAEEARGHVLAEGERGVALDGDVVVVVDPAQVGQLEMTGQRGRLARDALHHAAVAGEGVDVVVEHLEAGPVEVLRHPPGGDGHADAGGHPLPERAGRGLDAGGPAVLRMARALRVELAEALDVVERDRQLAQALVLRVDRLHAGQVQQGVEQHRGVADGQHEAVAVRPDRVLGIEAEESLPEAVDDGRHGHRRSRVARVRLLHGVHAERADGVDAELVDRLGGHGRGFLIPLGWSGAARPPILRAGGRGSHSLLPLRPARIE